MYIVSYLQPKVWSNDTVLLARIVICYLQHFIFGVNSVLINCTSHQNLFLEQKKLQESQISSLATFHYKQLQQAHYTGQSILGGTSS